MSGRCCFFLLLLSIYCFADDHYDPDWSSLDKRPIPAWFNDAKFGIFMHWGAYSVPSVMSEWFWWNWKGTNPDKYAVEFMQNNFPPGFTYADFGSMFTAELFDPDLFANTIKNSGANKHAEGYTMWPSNYSWNWNSWDVGPKRDLVGDLRQAILKVGGVHFGLYFCQFEWFNPLYMKDKLNSFKSQEYVSMVTMPQLHEIIHLYKPDILWSDGDYEASDQYWNSTQFIAWLYNESPVKDTIVTNDRWGKDVACHHGDFYTCDDRYDPGHLLPHKWESCMTIDSASWGFRRTMRITDVLTIEQLITKLVRTVSCGGNLLLNIGPTSDGRIVPIFEERLAQMGQWMRFNGEAIYGTKPWIYQNDTVNPDVWYTSQLKDDTDYEAGRVFNPQMGANTVVYAIVLQWPNGGILKLGATKPSSATKATMLGYNGSFTIDSFAGGLKIDLSTVPWNQLPTLWAWVIKLENLSLELRNPLDELWKAGVLPRT